MLSRIAEELGSRIASPRDDALTGSRTTRSIARSSLKSRSIDRVPHDGRGNRHDDVVDRRRAVGLAQYPANRERLIDEPNLFPLATEEFLRFYPPARARKRIVAVDTEFGGVEMKKGDSVLLSEAAAGRDESEFPNADEFVIDRNPNRHLSFGVGIHRCPGSHLARIVFSEMITAVLQRMPDYEITLDDVTEYPDWAMVGGWQRIPATFTPSTP